MEKIKSWFVKLNKWAEGRFTIYSSAVPHSTFARRRLRLGNNIFLRLHGINIAPGKEGLDATPVYIPMLAWNKTGKQLALDFHFWGTHPSVLFLMAFPPYIYWARNGVLNWNEEE